MAALRHYSSKGTKLYVSAAKPATEDAAGYAALAWTEVVNLLSVSDTGDTYADASATHLGDGRVSHTPSDADGGAFDVTCTKNIGDAGQVILQTAVGNACGISVKIQFPDIPCTGGVTTGSIEYKQITVHSDMTTGLTGGGVLGKTYSGFVNTATVKVNAA